MVTYYRKLLQFSRGAATCVIKSMIENLRHWRDIKLKASILSNSYTLKMISQIGCIHHFNFSLYFNFILNIFVNPSPLTFIKVRLYLKWHVPWWDVALIGGSKSKMSNSLLHFSSKEFEILDLDPPINATSYYGACHFRYNLALRTYKIGKLNNVEMLVSWVDKHKSKSDSAHFLVKLNWKIFLFKSTKTLGGLSSNYQKISFMHVHLLKCKRSRASRTQ